MFKSKVIFILFCISHSIAAQSKIDQTLSDGHHSAVSRTQDFFHSEISSLYDTTKAKIEPPYFSQVPLNDKPNSFYQRLQFKIDSLTKLPQPDTLLIKSLRKLKAKNDSLQNAVASLSNKLKTDELEKIQSSLDSAAKKVQTAVNEKLSLLSKNGVTLPTQLNVPALSLTDKIPAVSPPNLPNVHGVNMPEMNTKITTPDISQSASNPLGKVSAPSVQGTPATPSMQNLANANRYTGEVNSVKGNVSEYQKELTSARKDLNANGVEKEIEDKAKNMSEVGELQKELDQADQLKRYYDPDVAKEKTLAQAKQGIVNHFAGHEQELKAAIEKMSSIKAKFPNPEGTLDMMSKRQRLMKGKSFFERISPGLTFQFQKRNSFWLDLNPQLVFKISYRWQAGIGWNERLAYDFSKSDWDKSNHIYGVRSFVYFRLKGTALAVAGAENMNTIIRPMGIPPRDVSQRTWVWSYFAGVKKDFQLSKKVWMNVQALYNLYDPKKQSPYTDKLNARIGLEYRIVKSTRAMR